MKSHEVPTKPPKGSKYIELTSLGLQTDQLTTETCRTICLLFKKKAYKLFQKVIRNLQSYRKFKKLESTEFLTLVAPFLLLIYQQTTVKACNKKKTQFVNIQ